MWVKSKYNFNLKQVSLNASQTTANFIIFILGETPYSAFSVPKDVSTEKLKLLLRAFHQVEKSSKSKKDDEEDEDFMDVPYLFFINGHEIKSTIDECIKYQILNTEKTVPIVYQPQAIFK